MVYRLSERSNTRGATCWLSAAEILQWKPPLAPHRCRCRAGLSYRGDSISRAKPKNLEALDRAARDGRLRLMLQTQIDAIDQDSVAVVTPSARKQIANDDVIVCAGGVLPKDILESIGIQFSTQVWRGVSSDCAVWAD